MRREHFDLRMRATCALRLLKHVLYGLAMAYGMSTRQSTDGHLNEPQPVRRLRSELL